MLESPDYFFRVREIGRLRQTKVQQSSSLSAAHVCARVAQVCAHEQVNKFIDSKYGSDYVFDPMAVTALFCPIVR